jgi:hypothetical protein
LNLFDESKVESGKRFSDRVMMKYFSQYRGLDKRQEPHSRPGASSQTAILYQLFVKKLKKKIIVRKMFLVYLRWMNGRKDLKKAF